MTSRRLFTAATALVAVICLTATASASATAPDAVRQTATLTIGTDDYYAGQGVLFQGSLARTGERQIWLEFHMGRPGDAWTLVPGSTARTDRNGRFSFRHPAPGMYNISLRVNSAVGATPGRLFHAHDEMTTVHVAPVDGSLPFRVDWSRYREFTSYPAAVDEPFSITVDTSPEGGPILLGRTVSLEERVDADTWDKVTVGIVGLNGTVRFQRTIDDPGVHVYRARIGGWLGFGSDIGWNTSFPVHVYVLDRRGEGEQPPRLTETRAPEAAPPAGRAPEGGSSGQRYGWGETLYDFAYEWGESLTDAPYKGKEPRGTWAETSTGSGRAGRHNGGLFLESKYGVVAPRDAGPGDFGTTAATLRGNAHTTGRWEVRLRTWELPESGESYRVRVELVPEDPARRACGARAITVAEISPSGRAVSYGVTTPRRRRAWTGRRTDVPISQVHHAYGVEVTGSRITWLLDSRPIGTVRSRAALPRVPLTLRLSLVGRGGREMRHTYAGADWIRAWDLGNGRSVTSGHRLTARHHDLGC